MASIESTYITAIRLALTTAGFTVFDNILDHHTGVRTKSRTYVQIARSWERSADEVTYDCVQGSFTYRIRYHQASSQISNSAGEAISFDDASELVEKAISAVKTKGIFHFPNIETSEVTTASMRGRVRDYTITGTVSTSRNRS